MLNEFQVFLLQVLGFTLEQIAAVIAMIGILSVFAQVSAVLFGVAILSHMDHVISSELFFSSNSSRTFASPIILG